MGDFPCKQRPGVYDPPEKENVFTVGESFQLEFLGSAVHGGGSCQVSLTEDMQPTKNSVWKVIHSIEGGCPANTAGNLASDPSGQGASKFQITIPESIKPGEYTLAWSWINRIGNREFYMNCAPVTIQGPKKKRYAPTPALEPRTSIALTKRDDLPDMFVANINGCKTPEGIDVRFPNPGSSLEHAGNAVNLMKSGVPVCVWEDNPSKEAPVAGSGATGDNNIKVPEVPDAGKPGEFAPLPETEAPAPTATQAPAPKPDTPTPAPAPQPTQPPAPAPETADDEEKPTVLPPTTGNGGSALSGPCTEAGMFNCIGGTSFQQCASGQWSAVQPVAQGTVCKEGMSKDLGIEAAKKRGLHRRRGHFRA